MYLIHCIKLIHIISPILLAERRKMVADSFMKMCGILELYSHIHFAIIYCIIDELKLQYILLFVGYMLQTD